MRAGLRAGIISASSGGGGGGGGVNWNDINGFSTTGSISANSGAETVDASGTINLSYSGDAGITWSVLKNGASQGSPASLSVANGNTVDFNAAGVGFTAGETRTGTITVSGLYSDVINITLTDISV